MNINNNNYINKWVHIIYYTISSSNLLISFSFLVQHEGHLYQESAVLSIHHSQVSINNNKTGGLSLALTLATRRLAASSIPIFSLAEVSNQPANPFSLQ